LTVLAVNSVSDAWHVFTDHPVVLLLMPVVGGFIGWITKVLAIEMVFKPIEFKGIGPVGWQGQLPRRAAKFGSHAAELVLENLIDPRMLVDKLDPRRIATELDDVMVETVDDIAHDLIGNRWDQLPTAAKAPVYARARSRAPQMIASLLDYAKRNIDELFDLSYITTSNLIRDKALLNELVRDTIVPEMRFMKRFGTLFGAGVGAVQMVVFAFTENHFLIPLFGLGVGLVSDWIALQMVFHPREPKRYFGLLPWHGLFFKRRAEFAEDYAKLAAEKVLTPAVILDSLLNGPLADRLFGMVKNEVETAVAEELSIVEPLVPAAIGTARYNSLRNTVVQRAQARLPDAAARLEGYTAEAIDIENTAKESLGQLSDEEYEGMLRPVFKDDEWLVVAVGGGLGFFVGELQVFLLEKLGGL
jgi:uncharacterized membrane protein YheB (UPF0754 family)